MNNSSGIGFLAYCTITTLAESSVQQGVLWVGTDDGNIQLTRDGGQTWVKLNDHRFWFDMDSHSRKVSYSPGFLVKKELLKLLSDLRKE